MKKYFSNVLLTLPLLLTPSLEKKNLGSSLLINIHFNPKFSLCEIFYDAISLKLALDLFETTSMYVIVWT